MRLAQTCKYCDAKRAKQEAHIRKTVPEPLIDVTLTALGKPKTVTIKSEQVMSDGTVLVDYSCGHSVLEQHIESVVDEINLFKSITKGYTAYEYQKTGVEFALESNVNCLIADEQGLGKTVQALIIIRAMLDKMPEVERATFRCAIIVKPSTIFQWVKEHDEWATNNPLGIQPILSSKNPIIPIFNCYLVSMDLLPAIVDKLIALKLTLVIADEVQSFKNPGAARSKALVKLVQEGNVKHKVFLSGTPIKNRAGEYFTILNLLAPGHFPSWRAFVTRWLESETTASGAVVYKRLRRYAVEDFRKLTSRWIIRRETSEVQKDLPPIRFNYQYIEITDPAVKNSYNQQLDLFSNWYNAVGPKSNMGLLGWLAKLRHETEMAKMGEAAERAKEFLESTEEHAGKIAIGIHHKDVRDFLHFALNEYGSLKLSGEDSAQDKNMIVRKFQEPENRVMVINEQSGGVGLDGLQVCTNVILLARQWSPADEEQFIKRFNRDTKNLVANGTMSAERAAAPTLVTVLMAKGTIDTFFHEVLEDKKTILKDAYGNWSMTDDTASLMDLARTVISHRL